MLLELSAQRSQEVHRAHQRDLALVSLLPLAESRQSGEFQLDGLSSAHQATVLAFELPQDLQLHDAPRQRGGRARYCAYLVVTRAAPLKKRCRLWL